MFAPGVGINRHVPLFLFFVLYDILIRSCTLQQKYHLDTMVFLAYLSLAEFCCSEELKENAILSLVL
jgi:hypothetical protein